MVMVMTGAGARVRGMVSSPTLRHKGRAEYTAHMAIATLADLLAPVPEPEFSDRLRRREVALWRGRDPNRLTTLLDWAALDRLIASGALPPHRLRVTRQGVPVHPA